MPPMSTFTTMASSPPPSRGRSRMLGLPPLQNMNPLRLLQSPSMNFSYQRLPTFSTSSSRQVSPFSRNGARSPWPNTPSSSPSEWLLAATTPNNRRRCGLTFGKWSLTKVLATAITCVVLLSLLIGGGYQGHRMLNGRPDGSEPEEPWLWKDYPRINGYYNGLRALVPTSQHVPDNRYGASLPHSELDPDQLANFTHAPPVSPKPYRPYPDYASSAYLEQHAPVHTCYLDEDEQVPVPDVFAYRGIPQHMSEPLFGSYSELGLDTESCFERFGRFAAYGFGSNTTTAGKPSPGVGSENAGSEAIYNQLAAVDYTDMDWGSAQKRCVAKNSARFQSDSGSNKKPIKRHAYVLRTYTGYEYTEQNIITLRAMISELALRSGGEYDVHLLVQAKDDSIPIWANEDIYRMVIELNVPREFWNISTLWSEQQMKMYYPAPFGESLGYSQGDIHGVYRSPHFALQWFSQQHPEYDFFWNWEMDLRLTGHYFEFNDRIGHWAAKQPRKGLWERNRKFYIPALHGDYANFTQLVETETAEKLAAGLHDTTLSGPLPVWGPVQDFPNSGIVPPQHPDSTTPPTTYANDDHSWGVGEDADLLTFNPIFDSALENWVWGQDVTGFDHSLPPPPRRTALITVSRLSKRLLAVMHEETWKYKHSMFPEMWAPSVALHQGFKAVAVPHAVYFDRDWDLNTLDQTFNYPTTPQKSPFAGGEHNFLGSTFYFNPEFSGALWRRWLGYRENGEGGRKVEETGSSRMCLRSILHHPIKSEKGDY